MTDLDAQKLVIHPSAPAKATSISNQQLHLQWESKGETAVIYWRPITAPPEEKRELAQTSDHEITIPHPSPTERVLFTIHLSNGRIWETSERFISLQHGINFRDIGGYETKDGRQVCWGQVYRSGELGGFSTADWEKFARLNLNTVLDLRTTDEQERKDDNLPPHLSHIYRHQPIYKEATRSHKWLRKIIFNKRRIDQIWLEEVYIGRFITTHAQAFGTVLKQIAADEQRPTLIHCTAGKDRTGVSIALLLHILGVPRETIINEYTLSNIDYQRLLNSIEKDRLRMALAGLQTADLFPLLTAPAKVIQQTLAHVDQTYGSLDTYIRDMCQVDQATCQQLSNRLTRSTD